MDRKYIGYIRVSTTEQLEGNGLDVQRAAVTNYCLAMGYELVDIIEDPGESGSSLDRPGFNTVQKLIVSGEVAGVVVYKLDRISRNLKDILNLHDDVFVPNECAMISVKEQFDTSTAFGRLFFQIIGGFGEFERAVITERLADGITRKAQKGGHATGRTPLGYRAEVIDGKKTIIKDDEQAEVVKLIFSLKESGYSYSKIADHLNNSGIKPRLWTAERPVRFHASSVRIIHKNPKYHGIVTLNRKSAVITAENEAFRIL